MSDDSHQAALDETGCWGREGAGVILFSPQYKKFGLALRSETVNEPGTLGSIGGAIDKGHSIEETIAKELSEEIGYGAPISLHELPAYRDGSFTYHNFIGIIDDNQFDPVLNDEVDDIVWLSIDEMILRKSEDGLFHFGIQAILNHARAVLFFYAIVRSSMLVDSRPDYDDLDHKH